MIRPELSRRHLVGAGVFGVLAAPFLRSEQAFAAASARLLYRRSRFARLRGKRFRVRGVAGTMTLTRVSDLPSAPAREEGQFALTFRASGAGPSQGSYVFRRRGFTPTTLFVVPSANRRTFEAVVNRVR